MKTKFTETRAAKLRAYLDTHILSKGIGDKESACSIAAINLAIDGRLTDDVPACMSGVIGQWIIVIQDAMPDSMRNSAEWKSLLPLAAGTGRNFEMERLTTVVDWMWSVVLPKLQPIADANGFGTEWLKMTTEKAYDAANAAAHAAFAHAAHAAHAASYAAYAASYAADATDATRAARAVADATDAARAAACATNSPTFWADIDPCACLRRMIEVAK